MNTTSAAETSGASLRIKLERYVAYLLDQAQFEGIRGNMSGAVVRRLVARELGELLIDHRGDQ